MSNNIVSSQLTTMLSLLADIEIKLKNKSYELKRVRTEYNILVRHYQDLQQVIEDLNKKHLDDLNETAC